jgi:AcrR family transcriptional regulator
MTVPRPLDPNVGDAIAAATLRLLAQRGFAATTMDAVAAEAGVGKPAIYRRFRDKAALVADVISRQLPVLEAPDLSDTRGELWRAFHGMPRDGPSYLRLIGGLIAEQERHPELIEAFRTVILLPRRAAVLSLIERGQARGDIRGDLDAQWALDALAGPILARVFAGDDTGPAWRRHAFDTWWRAIAAERHHP